MPLNVYDPAQLYTDLKNAMRDVVRDYQAKGDGSSDDTGPIAQAIADVAAGGGGMVYFPPGVYISGNQTIQSNVYLLGAGIGATTIKLKNGANTDLFSGSTNLINLSASSGTSGAGTLFNFGWSNMTLDGNKANQTAGTSYPIRVYGCHFYLTNVVIKNGYSGGILMDWNGGATVPAGSDSMESRFVNFKIHDNNGIGLQIGGPHDTQLLNGIIYNSGSHNLHIAPNASALQFTNFHSWAPGDVGILDEGGYCLFYNCETEGSNSMNLAIITSEIVWHGHVFNSSSGNGIQVGQAAGNTPYAGQINQSAGLTTAVGCGGCVIEGFCDNETGTHGAVWFANSNSYNHIRLACYQTSGNVITGTPGSRDQLWITVNGLTPDGTIGKGGAFQISNSYNNGFQMNDNSGNQFLLGNARNAKLLVGNGGSLGGFSDAFFSTQQWQLNNANGDIWTNGWIATGPSATTPDPGAGGTVATANIGLARVTPAASRTACILAVGTQAGQEVWVVNNSASFTISWATQATSHIAGEAGGTFVLAANGAQKFVWDATAALWYKG